MTNEEQLRYSRLARLLHWTIGLLIIANILIGLFHDAVRESLPAAMPVHKALGITILALTLVRILWRLGHRPPLPAAMPGWEKGAAHATHLIFYALMLILPLTGWVMSSAGDRPLNWFGLFDIPKFAVTREDGVVGLSRATHGPLGFLFGLLALIHIAAALRHHIILKDGVLRRMLG